MAHERSKERVKSIGEVFTPPAIANEMLDLLDQVELGECKFFEPTCGNGNILIEATKRRLELVFKRNQERYPDLAKFKNAEWTICEIALNTFGADIMLDNVLEARERMKGLIAIWYTEKAYTDRNAPMMPSILMGCFKLIEKNIQHADCLAGLSQTYEEAKEVASKTKASKDFFEKHGWIKIHFGEDEEKVA